MPVALDNIKKRRCLQCGGFIDKARIRKQPSIKFCCTYCKSKYHKGHSKLDIPTGDKGAIGELLVCADLLKKKYLVFRAVHMHAPFDLVAIPRKSPNCTLRIEVRTGYKSSCRQWACAPLKHSEMVDVLAIFIYPSRIIYRPSLSEATKMKESNKPHCWTREIDGKPFLPRREPLTKKEA